MYELADEGCINDAEKTYVFRRAVKTFMAPRNLADQKEEDITNRILSTT